MSGFSYCLDLVLWLPVLVLSVPFPLQQQLSIVNVREEQLAEEPPNPL